MTAPNTPERPPITRFADLTTPEQAKVAEAFKRAGLTVRARTKLVVNGQPTRELAIALHTLSKADMDRSFEAIRYGVSRRTYTGMLPKTPKDGTSMVDDAKRYRAQRKQDRKAQKRLAHAARSAKPVTREDTI